MTSSLSCASPASATSNGVTITITPQVTPIVSIATANNTICAGSSVTFTATPVNGGLTPSYQWQVNGVNAGTNSNTFTSSSLTAGAQVKVLMTSNATCVTGNTATSNTITMTVNPIVTASVSITASTTTSCPGYPVTFTATPVNGGSTPSYQWQVNGINVGANSNVYTGPIITNGSSVRVIMTSNAACVTTPNVTSNTLNIAISNFVVPFGTISGNTIVQAGQASTITVLPGNAGVAPSLQWQDSTSTHGWQNISGAINLTINYVAAATGDMLRCIVTSTLLCANPVTVNSNVLMFTVTDPNGRPARVYPNPANDVVTLDMLVLTEEWVSAEIYTMNGDKMMTVNLTGMNRRDINIGHLRAGQYLVKMIKKNGDTGYVKFMKL